MEIYHNNNEEVEGTIREEAATANLPLTARPVILVVSLEERTYTTL
jgi:hypothetical protein